MIREQRLESNRPGAEKPRVKWTLPRPAHDLYLVAIASGPGVTSPHWAIPRPYQPTSPVWEPRVIGSTNPIRVDGDGDGKFTSARSYAKTIIQQNSTAPAKLLRALSSYDEAVAAQAASLCQSAGADVRDADFSRALQESPAAVERGFARFASTISTRR